MTERVKKSLVFLAGFMGSGKSTIGPILANTIGYEFVDLDALIERDQHRKITEIFRDDGEEKFRHIERRTVRGLFGEKHLVVSLGGGTITHQPTLDEIRGAGFLVYLKSDVTHIYHRLRSKADRPMLRDEDGNLLDADQLEEKIAALLRQREKFYEQADLVIHTDDKKIGYTIDELVKALKPHVDI